MADSESGENTVSGTVPTFDAAVTALAATEDKEAEERAKAAGTVFQTVWKAAEPLFAEGTPTLDSCPVCTTPLANTAAGSAEAIRDHIAKHLEELADYAVAKKARDNARTAATNEMRQAEEKWLLGVCRDFGVSVRIRPLERAYSYERSELASALGGLLKDAKLKPAQVPGVNNRFLTSLAAGAIENFGSHFQDGPYGDGPFGNPELRKTGRRYSLLQGDAEALPTR